MIILEFTLAFIPFMLLVLGLAQMMLLHAARLTTMHAANAAVRAAVVVLDDDPSRYGGEARGSAANGSARYAVIQRAAAGALVGVWPVSSAGDDPATLSGAIKVPARQAPLPGLLTPQNATLQQVDVQLQDTAHALFAEVTVRYPCLVPLARRVLCRSDNHAHLSSRSGLPRQEAGYAYATP